MTLEKKTVSAILATSLLASSAIGSVVGFTGQVKAADWEDLFTEAYGFSQYLKENYTTQEKQDLRDLQALFAVDGSSDLAIYRESIDSIIRENINLDGKVTPSGDHDATYRLAQILLSVTTVASLEDFREINDELNELEENYEEVDKEVVLDFIASLQSALSSSVESSGVLNRETVEEAFEEALGDEDDFYGISADEFATTVQELGEFMRHNPNNEYLAKMADSWDLLKTSYADYIDSKDEEDEEEEEDRPRGGGGGGGGGLPPADEDTGNQGNLGEQIKDIATGNLTPAEKKEAIKEAVTKFKDQITNATTDQKDSVYKEVKEALKTATSNAVLKDMDASSTKEVLDSMVSNLGAAGKDNKQIAASLAKLAQEYVKKAAVEAVQATVEGDTAIAKPTAEQLKKAFDAAKVAAKAALEQLNSAGIDTSAFKTVVTFDIQVNGTAKAQSIEIDLEELTSAAGDNSDETAINIQTKGASIVLSLKDVKSPKLAAVKNGLKAAAAGEGFVLTSTEVELTGDTTGLNVVGTSATKISATSNGKEVTGFENAVTVTLDASSLLAGTDEEKVAVYQLVDGQWVPVGGTYDGGQVTFQTKDLGTFALFVSKKSFSDLSSVSTWAQKEIEVLVAKGIANGKSETKFDPNGNVTRAEFAKLIVRALGLYDVNATADFTDVKSSDWFAADVATAAKVGIVTGVGNGKFNPNAKITRQEMATMAARALKYVGASVVEVDSKLNKFDDADKIQAWAREAVALSVNENVINGMTETTFAPNGTATRAQAAVIVYRTIQAK